jgi:hypothetical protein
MKRQTIAAVANARAAQWNAEALIKSERAWVQVVITKPPQSSEGPFGKGIVKIWPMLQNHGKTPANIEIISIRPHLLPKDDEFPEPPLLPAEPVYACPETVYTEKKAFIPPNAGIEPFAMSISGEDFRSVQKRELFLYIYGQVFYSDIAGASRVSSFCYLYSQLSGSLAIEGRQVHY